MLEVGSIIGGLMGSPGYMSPEQLQSARDVDTRTDIWALGVTLYQFVSARMPFTGPTLTEVAVKGPRGTDEPGKGTGAEVVPDRRHEQAADGDAADADADRDVLVRARKQSGSARQST